MVFETLLDPVLGPLLTLEPFWTILILSFGITLLINIAYLFLTDQKEMRKLKAKMKEYQKKIKEVQKKNPQKAMDIQKQAMEINMKYMKHSMKPTLYTFIPIIIIFGWMTAHLTFYPVMPSEPFTVTLEMQPGLPGEVTLSSIPELTIDQPVREAAETIAWTLSGVEGDYKLVAKYNDIEYSKDLLISTTNYKSDVQTYDGAVSKITVDMKKVKPFGNISLFGWKPGWLGAYILLSIAFSIVLRKVLNIS